MVDIHCHVLPGVDDGPRSIEGSLAMLRKAAAAGVETVVATPHLIRGLYAVDTVERKQMTADLQKAAGENGIDIKVRPGVENYLSPQILEDTGSLKEHMLGSSHNYILVELPMQAIPPYAESVLFNLITRGITPVLAHPERCMGIWRTPNLLYDLVTRGAIVQLNAGSILGSFGGKVKRVAQTLLTHGLVHVVASDMHSASSPTLDQALPGVEKLLGRERALPMFVEIPGRIVAGETFHKEPPVRIASTRSGLKGFLFGRGI